MTARCFIALHAPEFVSESMAVIQNTLKSQGYQGNFPAKENFHLTLRFLGDITPEQQQNVIKALSTISIPELQVSYGPIGFFKGNAGVRTVWANVSGAVPIQMAIDTALESEFPPDERLAKEIRTGKYTHHLTLLRAKRAPQISHVAAYLPTIPIPDISHPAGEIVLFKSTLTRNGSIYEPLYTHRFAQ
jgi:RNA 2',3'-cyclic 3'-phosphodiesterase